MINIPLTHNFVKEANYQALMQLLNQDADRATEAIFTQDIKALMANSFENTGYIFWLFQSLMFSRNDAVINKLREFGLTNRTLRWFMSLEELNQHLTIISNQGILIDSHFILFNTYGHLVHKFLVDFHFQENAFGKRDGVTVNRSTNYLMNLKSRRIRNGGRLPKSFKGEKDMILNDQINKVIDLTEGSFNIKYAIDASRGKTEKLLLKPVLEEGFTYDRTALSERKFLAIVYNLFRIIMLDKNMPDYDKVNSGYKKAIKQNGKTIGYKEKDYSVTEKAVKMKQYFYK